MANATLSATSRAERGKGVARKLRQNGQVPAVIYGHGRQPQSLAISARDLQKLLDRIAITSTVVELSLDGATSRTLIREIQRHPVKRHVMHIDFQELVAGETVAVRIPLVFVGIPEGVRVGGGILDQMMHEVEIEVDPANMPNHIDVDVSHLTIGHSIHVSDLKLPEGAKLLDDPELTICAVAVPKTVAEVVPVAEAVDAPAEPELIRKPKPAEGEEA